MALNQRVKLSGVDNLIDLKTAHVASVNCHLDARLDIAAPRNDTLYVDEATDLLRPDVSHALDCLLLVFTMHDEDLILSLKFRRELNLHILCHPCTVRASHLHRCLEVEPSLVHEDLEGGELVFPEVDGWLGHVCVDDLREQAHISHGVDLDSVDKQAVLGRAAHNDKSYLT